MRVYVMRHGEAVHSVGRDRDRQLTVVGESQARQSGMWLQQQCAAQSQQLDLALVSPYVRAQQTYTALNEAVAVKKMMCNADVVPSGDAVFAQSYIDFLLKEETQMKSMLIVSHMPFVSYLVDQMCGRHHSLLFATGAIAEIGYDAGQGRGQLIRQYTPQIG